MAYFSNSSDGGVLDELCERCIHGWDGEQNKQGEPCAVYMLQMMWNYSQMSREERGTTTVQHKNVSATYPIGTYTKEALVQQQCLDILVPNKSDKLCSMFVEVAQREEQP